MPDSSGRMTRPRDPEIRLVVSTRDRIPGRLDLDLVDAPEPELADIEAAAEAAPSGSQVIWGGEPTLRGDLPSLVRTLAARGSAPTLRSDGLLLTSPRVVDALVRAGLGAVRLPFHSARLDAHDWLVGQPGAGKRVLRAARTCRAAGLGVEFEITLTRPTRPHLVETVELLARLRPSGLVVRRVTARGRAAADFVALSPRLGLAQPQLEAAIAAAARHGMAPRLEGFPRCAAPAASAFRRPEGGVYWALPSALEALRGSLQSPAAVGACARCPGAPECVGAPADYVERFGMTEVLSESNSRVRVGELPPTPLTGGDDRPPFRRGRFPTTRLVDVRRLVARPSLAGDPLASQPRREPEPWERVVFLARSRVPGELLGDGVPDAPETTRAVRVRLVTVAQHGARRLRIASAGSMAHPAAAELLREATRLQLDVIEVAGEGSALDEMTDSQLRRLRGITRLDVALYAADPDDHDAVLARPGAWDATMRALDRLSRITPAIKTGCYGIVASAAQLAAFVESWDMGDLPGDPAFRLHPRGDDGLRELARGAAALPPGPARDAIAAVVPPCLLQRTDVAPAESARSAWGALPEWARRPSGSDRLGCYSPCSLAPDCVAAAGCPGLAEGWSAEGIAPVTSRPGAVPGGSTA